MDAVKRYKVENMEGRLGQEPPVKPKATWSQKARGIFWYGCLLVLAGPVCFFMYLKQVFKPGPGLPGPAFGDFEAETDCDMPMADDEWEELDLISKKVVRAFADKYLVEITVPELWDWLSIPDPAAIEWILLASISERELYDMVKLWKLTH